MSGWVRFENTTPDNLKVAEISDRGHRLWFNAICYCSRARSSGRVPATIIVGLSTTATKRAVNELLEIGLLERLDERTYLVHDFLDYNPSRERIEEMQEANRKRVTEWRKKRAGNGVTGSADVTSLQADYSRTRDRSEGVGVDPSSSTDDNNSQRRVPSRRAKQDAIPASLPDELRPVIEKVLPVLEAVQADRGGDSPTTRGVGLAMARFPDRDHMGIVRELEHWALAGHGQAKPVKDWARTYATFLERSPAGKPSSLRVVRPARENASDWAVDINGRTA